MVFCFLFPEKLFPPHPIPVLDEKWARQRCSHSLWFFLPPSWYWVVCVWRLLHRNKVLLHWVIRTFRRMKGTPCCNTCNVVSMDFYVNTISRYFLKSTYFSLLGQFLMYFYLLLYLIHKPVNIFLDSQGFTMAFVNNF